MTGMLRTSDIAVVWLSGDLMWGYWNEGLSGLLIRGGY